MPTPNVRPSNMTGRAGGLPPLSRRRSFLLATLFGLAWFPLLILAILIGNTVAGSLIVRASHPTQAQFQVYTYATDMTMLVLGSVFCFLVAPAALRVRIGAYRRFLVDIGVLGGSWRAVVTSGGLLLLVATLIAIRIPVTVPASFWRTDTFSWVDLAQPPLVEETLFRGVVLALLLKRFPAWFALLWAAVLFMPPHLALGPILMLENGLVFGVTQGLLRLRTRSIWPGALAHYIFVSGIGVPILVAYGVVLGALLLEWGLRAALRSSRRRDPVAAPSPLQRS